REAIEQQTPVNGTGNGTFDSAFVARVLTRRIYLELIHQEVVKRKLKVTADDLDVAKDQLLQSIGDEKMLERFPKSYRDEITRTTAEVYVLQTALADASDKNLRTYYEEHLEQFESVCASHILVEKESEADAIERQLKASKDKAATFAELAKSKSKDPGSGANGGDLGCASPAGYVEQFKDAVRKQPVGVIGDPVETQYGFHIIRVDKRDPVKAFEEVKEEVRQAITDGAQELFNEFLGDASSDAKIEINPRYGSYDKTGDSPQVVPPKAPSNNNSSDPVPTPEG
ncbi:MAG: peptidylprolyl isomerase, partial [Acidimicrobiales bacterium]|nr:peptidylprolyl isomerase [Acidimicrobiales bacterium]